MLILPPQQDIGEPQIEKKEQLIEYFTQIVLQNAHASYHYNKKNNKAGKKAHVTLVDKCLSPS